MGVTGFEIKKTGNSDKILKVNNFGQVLQVVELLWMTLEQSGLFLGNYLIFLGDIGQKLLTLGVLGGCKQFWLVLVGCLWF